MSEFKQFRRKQIAELRPFVSGEVLEGVSVSAEDVKAGSPKVGDMIARNPKNHADQWLVAAAYFADNFEPTTSADDREETLRKMSDLASEWERRALDAIAEAERLREEIATGNADSGKDDDG